MYTIDERIPKLCTAEHFLKIGNYIKGSKILILGEQDFSYTLSLCNLLNSGDNIIGTSYLKAYNPMSTEPEQYPSDDGIRANYFRWTLPSHEGVLEYNLMLLKQYNATIGHGIDGTKLYESLNNNNLYNGRFDIIVFPFPRASLKRGLDFRNSTLIQGFFNSVRINKEHILYPNSQIQLIILENQFNEWDITNIAAENGFILKWRSCVDFNLLKGYQPRELSGKKWNPEKNNPRLLVFLWDINFNYNNNKQLIQLNSVNHQALLPQN